MTPGIQHHTQLLLHARSKIHAGQTTVISLTDQTKALLVEQTSFQPKYAGVAQCLSRIGDLWSSTWFAFQRLQITPYTTKTYVDRIDLSIPIATSSYFSLSMDH